jgi:hypothetical protein
MRRPEWPPTQRPGPQSSGFVGPPVGSGRVRCSVCVRRSRQRPSRPGTLTLEQATSDRRVALARHLLLRLGPGVRVSLASAGRGEEIKAKVVVKVPAGATLVTGTTTKGPFAFPLEFSVPAEDFTMPIRDVRLPDGGALFEK